MTDFEGEREAEKDNQPKSKKQETADLEKVTDFAEEKELGSVNLDNLKEINLLERKRTKETQERQEELAKVNIKKEDVEMIVNELEITKQQAELALRQSNGDIVQAFLKLLS